MELCLSCTDPSICGHVIAVLEIRHICKLENVELSWSFNPVSLGSPRNLLKFWLPWLYPRLKRVDSNRMRSKSTPDGQPAPRQLFVWSIAVHDWNCQVRPYLVNVVWDAGPVKHLAGPVKLISYLPVRPVNISLIFNIVIE